jgi:sortase A
MNPPSPSYTRWLHRLANFGILLAVLLGTLPFSMRAYGRWSQNLAKRRFVSSLATAKAAPHEAHGKPPGVIPPRKPWETSVIQIPSIGVDAVVTEGAGKWELVIGPGHVQSTAGPGGAGNCVIAAHRNMWDSTFSELPRVKLGDFVYVTTPTQRYAYQIDVSKEISTANKAALRNTKAARLTLITCVLPFNAHRRWAVQGHLVEE